jgi:hypothetical protein
MSVQDRVPNATDIPSNVPKRVPIDLKHRIKGYSVLAEQMGKFPQLGIFHNFGALNARNILYLQAELTYLEQRLIAMEKRDNAPYEDE